MPKKKTDVAEILEQVQAQLAALEERMAKLEGAGATAPAPEAKPVAPKAPAAAAPPKPAQPAQSTITPTEEEMIAISAALGAFLGVRVRIKQIRLLTSPAWAQQGRVSIQASHKLHN